VLTDGLARNAHLDRELVAAAVGRADAVAAARLGELPPQCVNAAGQAGVGSEQPGPGILQELVPADSPASALHQEPKDGLLLRVEEDDLPGGSERPAGVQRERIELFRRE
jgi:hypothetical protein